jgi:hypothetical protein
MQNDFHYVATVLSVIALTTTSIEAQGTMLDDGNISNQSSSRVAKANVAIANKATFVAQALDLFAVSTSDAAKTGFQMFLRVQMSASKLARADINIGPTGFFFKTKSGRDR